MQIIVNKNNEIEYHFHPNLDDECADIAREMLDVMRCYHDDTSNCAWALVDDFDLTFAEAIQIINCSTDVFEEHISDLFNYNHNPDDFK